MIKALKIAALSFLALLFSSNVVWAVVTEGGNNTPPGPETLILFGAVVFWLVSANASKIRG